MQCGNEELKQRIAVRDILVSGCVMDSRSGAVVEMVETLNRTTLVGFRSRPRRRWRTSTTPSSVPGIDVAVVGNDDLSTGMGIPRQFSSDTYRDAVKEVIKVCNKHNVMPGIAAGAPELTRYWAGQGMKMFWAAAGIYLLWAGAAKCRAALRKVLA